MPTVLTHAHLRPKMPWPAEKIKKGADDKTGAAMKTLNEKYEFCNMKLAELQRQSDLRTAEIQDCLKKGQKERAKMILKRRKLLEGQIKATQNVRTSPAAAPSRATCLAPRAPPHMLFSTQHHVMHNVLKHHRQLTGPV
jgi:hypothetical protein